MPEALLDPVFKNGGIKLSESELRDVTQFVRTGLLDSRATKDNLCKLLPKAVPSGLPMLTFEGCADKKGKKDRD